MSSILARGSSSLNVVALSPSVTQRCCRICLYGIKSAGCAGAVVVGLGSSLASPLGPAPLAARGLRPCSRGPSRRAAVDR